MTNSSEAVGCTPTVASKSALVKPAFTATANPWEFKILYHEMISRTHINSKMEKAAT